MENSICVPLCFGHTSYPSHAISTSTVTLGCTSTSGHTNCLSSVTACDVIAMSSTSEWKSRAVHRETVVADGGGCFTVDSSVLDAREDDGERVYIDGCGGAVLKHGQVILGNDKHGASINQQLDATGHGDLVEQMTFIKERRLDIEGHGGHVEQKTIIEERRLVIGGHGDHVEQKTIIEGKPLDNEGHGDHVEQKTIIEGKPLDNESQGGHVEQKTIIEGKPLDTECHGDQVEQKTIIEGKPLDTECHGDHVEQKTIIEGKPLDTECHGDHVEQKTIIEGKPLDTECHGDHVEQKMSVEGKPLDIEGYRGHVDKNMFVEGKPLDIDRSGDHDVHPHVGECRGIFADTFSDEQVIYDGALGNTTGNYLSHGDPQRNLKEGGMCDVRGRRMGEHCVSKDGYSGGKGVAVMAEDDLWEGLQMDECEDDGVDFHTHGGYSAEGKVESGELIDDYSGEIDGHCDYSAEGKVESGELIDDYGGESGGRGDYSDEGKVESGELIDDYGGESGGHSYEDCIGEDIGTISDGFDEVKYTRHDVTALTRKPEMSDESEGDEIAVSSGDQRDGVLLSGCQVLMPNASNLTAFHPHGVGSDKQWTSFEDDDIAHSYADAARISSHSTATVTTVPVSQGVFCLRSGACSGSGVTTASDDLIKYEDGFLDHSRVETSSEESCRHESCRQEIPVSCRRTRFDSLKSEDDDLDGGYTEAVDASPSSPYSTSTPQRLSLARKASTDRSLHLLDDSGPVNAPMRKTPALLPLDAMELDSDDGSVSGGGCDVRPHFAEHVSDTELVVAKDEPPTNATAECQAKYPIATPSESTANTKSPAAHVIPPGVG